ncbi:MAG: sugar phosphate isomerase/epimerase [Clostridia bacterium]|nr:sugar phosphate isomerase/epimerase [Clostridia bacterium]
MIRLCAFSDEANPTLEGQIKAMKRNGIGLTELRSIAGKNVKDLTLEEAAQIKEELDAAGIAVWSIGSPLGKVDITADLDEYLKIVEHVCKLANLFGAERVRMFSFFGAYDQPENVYKYLRRMIEVADRYGVKLCHENEKDIFGDTLERVLQIMQHVQGLYYVYDPANFLQVNQLPEQTLHELHDKTEYFHIKDVIASTGEIVPAGYGDGMIDTLISMIDSRQDTVLTLEPHLRVFAGYAQIDSQEMKNKYTFENNEVAFDAAVNALKALLEKNGYVQTEGGFEKYASRT